MTDAQSKLLAFCGIKHMGIHRDGVVDGKKVYLPPMCGWFKDGKRIAHDPPPVHSNLDTQARYLFPKLREIGLVYDLRWSVESSTHVAGVMIAPKPIWYEAKDANPAHAIADATLKYLESLEKN
jgi:hypothetical protein